MSFHLRARDIVRRVVKHNKVVCPFCFERINLRRAKFRCSNDSCKPAVDKVMASLWGRRDLQAQCFEQDWQSVKGLLRIANKQSRANCPDCGSPSFMRLCPNCHKELPASFGIQRPFNVAIIGAKASGKSHFVAVLIDELKNSAADMFAFSLMAANHETATRYQDEFYKPLYESGHVVNETKSAKGNLDQVAPMVYQLKFEPRHGAPGAEVTLSFFDAPGEDLKQDDTTSRYAKYVYHADGLILLVDCSSLIDEGARQRACLRVAADILERVIRVYQVGRQTGTRELPASIAVAFSKFDLLRDHFPGTSNIWQSPKHTGYYDFSDYSDVSLQIESKMRELKSSELPNLARGRFGENNVGFFGLSALGQQPTGTSVQEIKPLRVAEPLLWLLAQESIIPVKDRMGNR